MSSLREIRDHIASVRGTLKITSALKLVSSSKLRKAQRAVETLLPYEKTLSDILASCHFDASSIKKKQDEEGKKTALVLISSNSSMCGGFNVNAVKKALALLKGPLAESAADVYALGRKGADSLRREGFTSRIDGFKLIAKPSYEEFAALAARLSDEYDDVILVYNHFVSTSRQEVLAESLFDFASFQNESVDDEDYIIEPGAREVIEELLPKVIALKLFSSILDSAAAEHAARMLAMQTATDNGESLLSDLTLEYNKGRQQKITAEILDLVGGSVQ